jgi:hypothetical protein
MQMNWTIVNGAVAVYAALLSTWIVVAKHLADKCRIKGSIDKIYVKMHSPEQLQGETRCDIEVFIKAALRNESERQTTIQTFGLTIRDVEETHASEYLGESDKWFIQHDPGKQDSCGGVSGRKLEYLTDLGADTAKNPVVRGIHREGWLHFKVADINPQSAEKGLYCLTATDPSGVKHKICCRKSPPVGSGELLERQHN